MSCTPSASSRSTPLRAGVVIGQIAAAARRRVTTRSSTCHTYTPLPGVTEQHVARYSGSADHSDERPGLVRSVRKKSNSAPSSESVLSGMRSLSLSVNVNRLSKLASCTRLVDEVVLALGDRELERTACPRPPPC